jgi:hypothetical protein
MIEAETTPVELYGIDRAIVWETNTNRPVRYLYKVRIRYEILCPSIFLELGPLCPSYPSVSTSSALDPPEPLHHCAGVPPLQSNRHRVAKPSPNLLM